MSWLNHLARIGDRITVTDLEWLPLEWLALNMREIDKLEIYNETRVTVRETRRRGFQTDPLPQRPTTEPDSTVNSFVHSRLLLRLCLGLLLLAGAPSVVEAQGDPALAKREIEKLRTPFKQEFKQELDAMMAAAMLAGPMHDCVEENIKRYTLVIPGQFEVIVAAAYGACRTIVYSYLENERIHADLKNQRTESDKARKGRVSPPTLQSLLQENRPRWLHLAIELELARQQRNAPTSQ